MTTTVNPRSGLDQLLAIKERGSQAVGVMELLGARLEAVEAGRVVFACETRPAFGNPMGLLHGGITATMLDSAMGCAVLSALDPGAGYTTVDLAVTYLRAVALDGVTVTAEGCTVHVGRRIATASGTLTDDRGRLLATATTTCLVLGGPS